MLDTYGRPLRTLRLSVTDRCNLRCHYCMPEEDYRWLPREDLLSFEEIVRIADLFGSVGVDRLRVNYQSMVTPNTVYDYHLADGRLETLKVREIPSGYDASQYVTERLLAPAREALSVSAKAASPVAAMLITSKAWMPR